jgi:hypothetical protein
MKQLNLFVVKLLLITGISLAAHADEVYKTVDENGNVVFSDKKTQDAETINVQPNVVDLDIPEMPEPTAQEKSNKPVSSYSGDEQQEMTGWNTTNGNNLRRRVRTETNGEGINHPRATATPGGRAVAR